MQRALRATSLGRGFQPSPASRVNKFLIAGVTVAGAAAIAVNPALSDIAQQGQTNAVTIEMQQRAVKLTSDISDLFGDYESVIAGAGANLQTLGSEAGVAIPALLQAIGSNLSGYGSLINTALTGTETSLKNALYGGWYGGDDGYVFGLFGGTVTGAGVTESGSTLQEIFNSLKQGNVFNAFSYLEEWSLEVLDHTLKPLLSPFLNTAKSGATPSATIPGEILQTISSVMSTMFTYSNLKAAAETVMSPALSVAFGLLGDITKIGSDVSTAKIGTALTDILKVPADLVGDLLNGYTYVNATTNPTNKPFTGLLNAGSLLQDLLYTWPEKLVTALKAAATSTAATATTTAATAATTAATVATSAATVKTVAAAATATAPAATTATSTQSADTTSATSSKKKDKKSAGTTADSTTADSTTSASSDASTSSDGATATSSKKHDGHGKQGADRTSAGTASAGDDATSSTPTKKHDGQGKAGARSGSHGSAGSGGHK